MSKDYFDLVYVVGVVLITVMMFILAKLTLDNTRDLTSNIVEQNTGDFDIFGRLRVSEPYTLGDYKHVYGVNPDMLDYKVSGGDIVHNANESSVKLSVTDTVGSRAVHQSKMYHHYMPGKSQLIMNTFIFKDFCKGVSKKTGYFDDRTGIFFEYNQDGVLCFNIRSYTSGSAVDRTVEQKDWNGDKLDGSGKSKLIIDMTKTQLFWIDFQWLAVGKARCGFLYGDDFILCHTFYNVGILDKVYMDTANLPTRCEIANVSSNESCNFDQICSTVISEGGYSEAGRDYSILSSTQTLGNSIGSVISPIGILLKTTFNSRPNRMFARLLDVRVFSSGSNVKYEVLKVSSTNTSASITGTTISANNFSGLQYINNCTIAGTVVEMISSGVVSSSTQGGRTIGTVQNLGISNAKKNFIAQNYDSTHSDAFVIRVTQLQATVSNIIVSMTWREVY